MDMPKNPRRIALIIVLSIMLSALYHAAVWKRAVVDVSLTTSAETVFKIYWAGPDEPFSEKNSAKVYLHPDTSQYTMRIGDLGKINTIRVDTSDRHPAVVTIRKMTISQLGYEEKYYGDPSAFSQFTAHEGIEDLLIDENGLQVTPQTEDPQLLLTLHAQSSKPTLQREALHFLSIVLLVWAIVSALDCSGRTYRYVPYLLVFVSALVIVMASTSKFNHHPDEMVHVRAANYYQNNSLPPEIGSPAIKTSYSVYGVSRLHSGEIVYLLAGKFQKLLEPLHLDPYVSARSFNVVLFLLLVALSFTRTDFRICMLIVLISPQIWYIFSYFNSDAFALFMTLLAGYLLANPDSLFHQSISGSLSARTVLYLLFCGILLALLLLVKKNFYFFNLFMALYLTWAIIFKKIQLDRTVVVRLASIGLIGFSIFGTFTLTDSFINGFEKKYRLELAKENFAKTAYKPSTTLESKHPFLQMKARGITLTELLLEKKWAERIFRSSFGVYGYRLLSSSNFHYDIVRISGLMLVVLILSSIFVRGGLPENILLATTLVIVAGLILVALRHAWVVDFQAQGRYLFPCIGMIAILFYHTERFFPRPFFHSLICLMFLLAVYSFITVGLYEIEKFGA